jgi:hypothetical protein
LKAWNAPFCRLLGIDSVALGRGEILPVDPSLSPDTSSLVTKIDELDVAAKRTGQPVLVSHQSSTLANFGGVTERAGRDTSDRSRPSHEHFQA